MNTNDVSIAYTQGKYSDKPAVLFFYTEPLCVIVRLNLYVQEEIFYFLN